MVKTKLVFASAVVVVSGLNGSILRAAEQQYQIDGTHADVLFDVDHLGFTHKHGTFHTVSGSLRLDETHMDRAALDITIDPASIDAGDTTRDKALRSPQFFDVVAFPAIHFVSRRIELRGDNGLSVEGALSMHGITKSVALQVQFKRAGENPFNHVHTLGFVARTALRRSDFGMSEFIPMVGDEVTVLIEAEFSARAPGTKHGV